MTDDDTSEPITIPEPPPGEVHVYILTNEHYAMVRTQREVFENRRTTPMVFEELLRAWREKETPDG
jgi:hypothetical protein